MSVAAPEVATGGARTRADLGGLARGGVLGLLGAGVSAAAGVLVVVVLARALPAAEAGVFFAVTSVLLLGQAVAKLGTNTSLVYYLSRWRALGVPERIPSTLRVALLPVVAVGLLIAIALYAAAPWLSQTLAGDTSTTTVAALRVCAVLVPVAALADALVSATRGFDTLVPTVLHDRIGRSLLQVLAVVVAVLLGWTAVAILVAAWALPWLLPAALGGRDLARRLRTVPRDPAAAVGGAEFWRFSGPRALASLAQIALQRLDIVLVAALLGPAPAAVYTAASRVLIVGQLANQAISTAVQARLGGLLATGDVPAANAAYRAATAWLVLLNWPLYLMFAVFAPQLLALFGPDYADGRSVVLILAAVMLLASACGMVNLVLVMAGRSTWNLGNALLALGVNVALDLLLIPRLGISGAAVGWAVAIAVSNLVALAQIHRSAGLHPFGRATLVAMAVAAACFGVLPAAALAVGPGAAALAAGLGAMVYVAVVYRLRRVLQLDVVRR